MDNFSIAETETNSSDSEITQTEAFVEDSIHTCT